MKNWFIKNRFEILKNGVVALLCALIVVITIYGINDIKNTTFTFDDGIEDIELTDEMVEAYVTLAHMSDEEFVKMYWGD